MDSYYDVIIVGSGMAGLYAAVQVRKLCPDLTCIVIERNQLFGGKAYEHRFENTDVVTGAGIGRKNKDKLLLKLMREFQIPIHFFETEHKYSDLIHPPCDVKSTFALLKRTYESENHTNKIRTTFKAYATAVLGEASYEHFILCAGYSDYEQADAHDTLYHYNFDDNYNKWTGFSVPWKALVDKMVHSLGHMQVVIVNNTEVTKIHNMTDDVFEVVLASSGRVIPVAREQSILAALISHGIDLTFSCEQGVCGTCLTNVLEGTPDHRDMYLTPEEQSANDKMLDCCSRAKSSRLVLEL